MAESIHNQLAADDQIHLLDYLIIAAKYSRMIIFASAGVMVLTYLALLLLPSKYTATARLLPPQQNLTLSGQLLNTLGGGGIPGAPVTGGISGLAAGFLGLKSPSDLYVDIMTGPTVYNRIIDRFNLRQLYKEKYLESARKTLSKNAVITAQKDGIINIEFTDQDPKRAAEVANAFAEELDDLMQGLAVQEAKGRLAFLEKERLQTLANLTKAEDTLRTFSEQNNVIQIDTQTRGALEYIARLRAEIDAKEVQIQVMRQQATRYNYDVVRLETELQGLKGKLKTAENQYDQLCVSDVCLTTAKVPSLGLEYLRLYREVKFQEALNLLYAKVVELARLDMVKDFNIVQVVDRALPPEKSSNKIFLRVLLAGAITFFVMILMAFILEGLRASRENSQRLRALKDNLKQWARPFQR
jgi:uncharacterized protein involved in exopolysaccharide biosynthesis